MSTNSTSIQQPQASSSQQPTMEQIYAQTLEAARKPRTPAQIKAYGDIKVKIGVLWFVGAVCSILSIFGGAIFFKSPDSGKDIWVIIGPIITAAVTGTLAYLTGEKNAGNK